MSSFAVVILPLLAALADSNSFAAQRLDDAHEPSTEKSSKWPADLVDRSRKASSLKQADLDDTTLSKLGNLAIPARVSILPQRRDRATPGNVQATSWGEGAYGSKSVKVRDLPCLKKFADPARAGTCMVPDPVAALQNYLRLRTTFSGFPLPDEDVECLVCRVALTTGPVSFNKDQILGDWRLVWHSSNDEDPDKMILMNPPPSFSNFIINEDGAHVMRDIIHLNRKGDAVIADVAYNPPVPGSEMLNRLDSRICSAQLQVQLSKRFGSHERNQLRIPLPLRGEGWLDLIYLSDEMRITRGSSGDLFVHLRPNLVSRAVAKAKGETYDTYVAARERVVTRCA